MFNFEEKFNNWQERMNQKTEKEKHNYALSVAFFLTALVAFFIISNWYFILSGNNINSSLFTDIQEMFDEQKENFNKNWTGLKNEKDSLVNEISATSTQ